MFKFVFNVIQWVDIAPIYLKYTLILFNGVTVTFKLPKVVYFRYLPSKCINLLRQS